MPPDLPALICTSPSPLFLSNIRPSCVLDSLLPVPRNKEPVLKLPEEELKVKFVPVFGARFPEVVVTNNGLQVVSDDSSATVIVVGTGKLVKFAPLIAGSVPVKFAAGKLVKFAPLPVGLPVKFPTNVVAVTTPDITCVNHLQYRCYQPYHHLYIDNKVVLVHHVEHL